MIRRQRLERRDSTPKLSTRASSIEFRAADDGTIEGYGSVFNVKDAYGDVIVPGAFAASLAAHRANSSMPAMLWSHRADEPIGVWTDMSEDSTGLLVKGKLLLDTQVGAETYTRVKSGAVKGLSIGFIADDAPIDSATGIRTVRAIDLWEVSVVTFPANPKAEITHVKNSDGLVAPKDAEKILREAGFSKSDATAFVSRLMRMGEERRDAAHSSVQCLRAAERLLATLQP